MNDPTINAIISNITVFNRNIFLSEYFQPKRYYTHAGSGRFLDIANDAKFVAAHITQQLNIQTPILKPAITDVVEV
ncbi:hypothetical protein [Acinetobacter tjernbergiae]|uniref:hypothetical protein n=1 Tax=Acinetobacter tjernbergiae TaxID=202955 RepID=UPI000365A354|nr:hypothetical protein [Acinetobacter tjernbergiae]